MKNGKRILSVTIKQMTDESPDTSHLGEYSNRSKSNYAIDRKHTKECYSNIPPSDVISQLKRTMYYLDHIEVEESEKIFNPNWIDDYSDAINILCEKTEELTECNCDESGYWSHGELQYFNPNFENYDGCTDAEIREYCWQDYERMESLNNGSWCFIGITAIAEIQLGTDVVQEITSGGLWGIESDDNGTIKQEKENELDQLKDQLLAIGFSKRAISTAFKNVKESE